MNTDEINANSGILETLLDKAVLDVMAWADNNCVRDPQEPDYIAALATKFTCNLYHILQSVFPQNTFSVSGVYCHQKPIVDINYGKKPELGDLLLVYIDRDCAGKRMYNALLLQAKIANRRAVKIRGNDLHQLELYKRWPEFVYCRTGYPLDGKKRNICPKTINDGAQYLLIDVNPYTNGLNGGVNQYPMGCAIPDQVLKIDDKFTREVINFLKFKAGRTFEDYKARTEDWSRMIWDLLYIGCSSCSKRKNLRLDRFQRGKTYVHLCAEEMRGETLFDKLNDRKEKVLFDELNDMKENSQYKDDDFGVSLILIENNSFADEFRIE